MNFFPILNLFYMMLKVIVTIMIIMMILTTL